MLILLRVLYSGLLVDVLLRPLRRPYLQGPGLFFALFGLALVLVAGLDWWLTPVPHNFDASGIFPLTTQALLIMLSAYTMATLARRRELVWDLAALLLAAALVYGVMLQTPAQEWLEPWLEQHHPALIQPLFWTLHLWWFLIVLRIAARLHAPSPPRWMIAGVLVFCLTYLPWGFLPKPAFWNTDELVLAEADGGTPGNDALDQTAPDPGAAQDDGADDNAAPIEDFDAEAVIYDQPRLMQLAVDAVAAHSGNRPNLYLVGFAGDGEENVFRNEVEFVEQQFIHRFDAAGHTLLLENNVATLDQRPLASLTNLETALGAVAKKMRTDDDVLLLFLTSHGSEDHLLYVNMDPLPLNQIGPEDLADILDRTPIRWKVVVISACYSGGFIDALKNSTSMVITAAREDRTSFGCGADSDITWFSKAFFAEGLNQTDSFPAAFARATQLVGEWETRDHEKPSYPQLATTPLIEEKLREWRAGIHLGAPLPFAPVAPAHRDDEQTAEKSSLLNVGNATTAALGRCRNSVAAIPRDATRSFRHCR